MGEFAPSPVGATNHRQAAECSTVGRPGLGIARKQDGASAGWDKMQSWYSSLAPLRPTALLLQARRIGIDFRVEGYERFGSTNKCFDEICSYVNNVHMPNI